MDTSMTLEPLWMLAAILGWAYAAWLRRSNQKLVRLAHVQLEIIGGLTELIRLRNVADETNQEIAEAHPVETQEAA